ncbi:hypothetical protein P154DRAFT_526140 [Amniculicola lignicola CBS 123094]|uniref:Uncharacterized protein n=1 Tax=Amniculicola lignicola CBS 123094 TaxID=1392246 RepID=A0A6A5W1Y4_9PLEO|nr:hypothetical protein P154DRAFT_526140 [Amniculicola lignicola CBS 123094]
MPKNYVWIYTLNNTSQDQDHGHGHSVSPPFQTCTHVHFPPHSPHPDSFSSKIYALFPTGQQVPIQSKNETWKFPKDFFHGVAMLPTKLKEV